MQMNIKPATYGWRDAGLQAFGRVVQGGPVEGLQQTCPGNWRRLSERENALLLPQNALRHYGCLEARPMWQYGIPFFRLPRIPGGWKTCAVMEILDPDIKEGFLVWHADGSKPGLSLVPFERIVRALIGPKPVTFYGFHADGMPLRLRHVVRTTIFDENYKHVTLR